MSELKINDSDIVIGFWERFLTDIIDTLILGAFGILIFLPYKNIFYNVGENGLFIGLGITFLYAGILQSYIGKGQSLAKQFVGIQVLKLNGEYLTLSESFLRYILLALIFYNNSIWYGITSLAPFMINNYIHLIYTSLYYILLFSTVILMSFHPQKRGLHDLIAGSIVVKKDNYNKTNIDNLYSVNKLYKAKYLIIITSILIIIISFISIYKNKDSYKNIKELTVLQKELNQKTSFSNVQINRKTFTDENKLKTTTIYIKAFIKKPLYDDDKLCSVEIDKAIKIIIKHYSYLYEFDKIKLIIRTGLNIGIVSTFSGRSISYNIKGELLN